METTVSNTSSLDIEARRKLLKARSAMVLEHPFFASLALRLDLREDRDCHTAYTDGQVFGYNPGYIRILSHDKLVGLAAHTVMHPACSHHKRRKDRDPKLWNQACDYVINPILLDAGLTLPDGFLMDQAFSGKSADAVYTALAAGQASDEKEESRKDDPSAEKNDPPDPGREETDDRSDQAQAAETTTDPSAGDDPGMSGEVRDGKDRDPTAAPGDAAETDWEQALVQAAASARAMGKLPRGLNLFVEERLRPRLPWRDLLARFIQMSARQDYTWTRPNRRYVHQDLYFPALVSDQLPEIAVAVDTSGSVRPEELSAFGAEVSAVLEMTPARLHLMYADMSVTRYREICHWDLPVSLSPKGGGGTDFRAVFEFMARKQIYPVCLIYLSDMECRLFPPSAPGFPVLWVQVGQGGVTPPFGKTIRLITA